MTKNNSEEIVVIKGAIPKALKLQFKVVCVQKELEMSEVLENLIKRWIQTDTPVIELSVDWLNQELEDVKAYVPKSLKHQFKLLCTQKRITIRSTLHVLIEQWLQMEVASQFYINADRKNSL
ncbi:hypothetical protein ACEYW6_27205 [Nostoc sp. UIC 10607]|uniref:hypothetical protein n=1 Tax=unclassified Nostoc TaxID=2593658 RepID=UPI0018C492EC|nr:hypothetical protein [Nostoc sp. NZL]MBG1239686.1 hypothetical protein [Nostoc sp. NZL]